VILVSFHDAIVQEIRARNPRIVTGAGIVEMLTFQMLAPEEEAAYVPPCPILQLPSVSPEQLDRAHRLGMRVQVWTFNDADDMRAWLDLGVDGVMTDDPVLLEQVLRARGEGRSSRPE
jgi:glycerophosphoryl diester phosphodiesterase